MSLSNAQVLSHEGGAYKLSPAENAVGAVPLNFGYAPGVVDRYKVNATPGTTTI